VDKPLPPESSKPAPVELPQTVQACHELIGKLWDSVIEKDQRLKQLEGRLKLNSRNSSKPPSSDGPGTPPAPRTRPKSGNPDGHPNSPTCGHPKFPRGVPPQSAEFDPMNLADTCDQFLRILGGSVFGFWFYFSNGCLASEARQAVGERPRSGGQLSHRHEVPAVHRLALWAGQLCTADGNHEPAVVDSVFDPRPIGKHERSNLLSARQSLGRLLQPVTLALKLQQCRAMHQPIQNGRAHGVVAQLLAPKSELWWERSPRRRAIAPGLGQRLFCRWTRPVLHQ